MRHYTPMKMTTTTTTMQTTMQTTMAMQTTCAKRRVTPTRVRGARCAARGVEGDDGRADAATSTRRMFALATAALGASLAWATRADAASSSTIFTQTADGVEFADIVRGEGNELYAGDVVVVTFSARVLPNEGERDVNQRRLGDTFDPFIVGGAGASMSKGFKLEIDSPTNDAPVGWTRAFVGDGASMPPSRIGTRRVVRIPAALAYGDKGHHCRDGVRTACEVPPGATVEIEYEVLRYT